MSTFATALLATKQSYPFASWRKFYADQPEASAACDEIEQVFDQLVAQLVEFGESATEKQKVALFELAIVTTNKIDENAGVIETGEREDLCGLTNRITTACGLDPSAYADGEGLASLWREW